MGFGKAPKPESSKSVAAAQTGTNVTTALANAALNNVDEYTPDGSKTFSTNGFTTFTDPSSGRTYQVPKYSVTTKLSDQQQAIKDQEDLAQKNIAGLAANQSAFLGDYLGKPFDLSNEATEKRLFDLGRNRLDPKFQQQRASLESSLSNKGIKMGSSAYDRALNNFGQQENDAYNQLLLSGRQQAVEEALTQRNQPINEITALLSGSQVSMPQFQNPNMGQIPTTDYAGISANNYNQQMQQYNANKGNSLFGGLFGLGRSLATGAFL